MTTDHRAILKNIRTFPSLVRYLRDEMGWPIETDDFEEISFEYTPEELGIDEKNAAKIDEIKRLRPLAANQLWGIFFVKFEPKRLPVVALRRILSKVVMKKRAAAERAAWSADDLLFVSNYGEGDERKITFAHFSQPGTGGELPILKVLGWDDADTALHLDGVAEVLTSKLMWPSDEEDAGAWREQWRSAFTIRYGEIIKTSKDLSIRLASLAKAIRKRILRALSIETEHGPLTRLMKAFQEALVHDLDADGFADMYAQTIAYGLLSARIADPHSKTAGDFAGQMRTNPFLKELMQTFLKVGGRRGKTGGPGIDFDELGVSEVVELLDDANMAAVVRDFGDKNPQEDPVIHFYELFLKEYDAKKRMQRGVFYTPRPVVSYIVRSVDELLHTEFGLKDGLADTTTWEEMAGRHKDLTVPQGVPPDQAFVQILDPACGTGTFLVEVIDLIHKALVTKWKAQSHSEKRIEALWNEYVPNHLLPRLYGYELLMAPYAIAHLKIGLKLYETGYRFSSDERARIYLTNALEPASDFSGTFAFALPALAREAQEVNEIKRKQRFTVVIGNPPYSRGSANTGDHIEKLIATYKDLVSDERNIQPLSDDYIKFIGLAQHVLGKSRCGVFGMITNNTFLSGRIHRGMREVLIKENSHIRVINLHGSQKVGFLGAAGTGDQNVFDILQGVSISLITKGSTSVSAQEYAELIGTRYEKYVRLLNSQLSFSYIVPVKPYYMLVPWAMSGPEYQEWPSLTEIIRFQNVSGKPGEDDLLVSFNKDEVIPKLKQFRKNLVPSRTAQSGLTEAGRKLAAVSPDRFDQRELIPYAYRPFDTRYTYYDPRIWTRPVERLKACIDGSPVLLTTKLVKDAAFAHVFITRMFPDVIFLSNTSSVNCYAFPRQKPQESGGLRFSGEMSTFHSRIISPIPNKPVSDDEALRYVYAVLHSPTYRIEYLDSLRLDFPRIPVAHDPSLLYDLIALGGELIALHLMESPLLNNFITVYIGPKKPDVVRVGWSDDTVWLDAAATKKGQPATPGTIGFHGVPEAVWNFQIGGYQVCEKWLKDRKGRSLTVDDIAHYQKIVVALNETIRLMKEIDEVIDAYGGWPGAFIKTRAPKDRKYSELQMVAEEKKKYGGRKL